MDAEFVKMLRDYCVEEGVNSEPLTKRLGLFVSDMYAIKKSNMPINVKEHLMRVMYTKNRIEFKTLPKGNSQNRCLDFLSRCHKKLLIDLKLEKIQNNMKEHPIKYKVSNGDMCVLKNETNIENVYRTIREQEANGKIVSVIVKVYGYGTNITIYKTGIGIVEKRNRMQRAIYDFIKNIFEKGIKNA